MGVAVPVDVVRGDPVKTVLSEMDDDADTELVGVAQKDALSVATPVADVGCVGDAVEDSEKVIDDEAVVDVEGEPESVGDRDCETLMVEHADALYETVPQLDTLDVVLNVVDLVCEGETVLQPDGEREAVVERVIECVADEQPESDCVTEFVRETDTEAVGDAAPVEEKVRVIVSVTVADTDAHADAESVTLVVDETDGEKLSLDETVDVGDTEADTECVDDALSEPLMDGHADGDRESVTEAVGDDAPDVVDVLDAHALGVCETETVDETELVPEKVGKDAVAVVEGVGESDGEAETVGDAEKELVTVELAETERLPVDETLDVRQSVGVVDAV